METKSKIFDALCKAQAQMKPAILDMINPHFKSKYASLTSVQDAYKKPLYDNGLSVLQLITSENDDYYIETILGHSPSGESISSKLKLILQRRDMQGLGSAITYAKRYAVSAMLGVVDTEDDDGNASMPSKPLPIKKEIKNHAPVSYPQDPPTYPQNEDFPDFGDARNEMLNELYALVESRNLTKDETRQIIREVLGEAKLSTEMTLEELRAVFKTISKSI